MRQSNRLLVLSLACVCILFATVETKRYLIPILAAGGMASGVLWSLLILTLASAAGWGVCRLRAEDGRGQRAFGFAASLSLSALLFFYECLKDRVVLSVLFAAAFLLELSGVIDAYALPLSRPKRKAERRPGVLRLSVQPDGGRLMLRWQGALQKKGGRGAGRLQTVEGEAPIARDFFWDRDADRVAAAIRKRLPSLLLELDAAECRILDPTGTETALEDFLPYVYLTPERADGIALTDEAVLLITEHAARESRYSVGKSGGGLLLHRHADAPAGDAFYRLPHAFFFRDSERSIRADLTDLVRCADAALFAALRDGEPHTLRFADDFSLLIMRYGYAQPVELSPADYVPMVQPPFPHIRLIHETPLMITKPDETSPIWNTYSVGQAKGKLYVHRRGDDLDDWGDVCDGESFYMLDRAFFRDPEESIRRWLIELALGSENCLQRMFYSGAGQPTARFAQDLSETIERFRQLQPDQPRLLEQALRQPEALANPG
ncbi:MAG: hypothetical protein IJ112_00760 [Oscillospiraceae bacterium]|nr:hypothetical protein [Oscillospiraceae bacterium]